MGAPAAARVVSRRPAGQVTRRAHSGEPGSPPGRLWHVSVAETLLVYAGAPLLVTLVLAAWTLRPDKASRRSRYRPGQPWEHEPVWYAPHTGQAQVAGHGDGADTAATPHGRTDAVGSSVYGEVEGGPAAGGPHMSADAGAREGGGVHGQAHGSRGATAITAGAPVRGRGGPLGGARGTW